MHSWIISGPDNGGFSGSEVDWGFKKSTYRSFDIGFQVFSDICWILQYILLFMGYLCPDTEILLF